MNAKHPKPLRRPPRTRLRTQAEWDAIDAEQARKAAKEPGTVSLAELKRRLDANPDALRIAEENTIRLTGKPRL